jgi:hypothetical protein
MSDLSAKFTGLQTLLSTQHDDLMTALTATNAKLDALLEAFGVPPPVPGVTLADIKDVLDDIHLDTQSIDLKLLRVRDAIAPLDEALPTGDKTAMAWSIYRLMDATAPDWPRPTSVPLQPALELLRGDFADVVGINADGTSALTVLGRLTSLLDSSGNIEDHIGIPTGDATTTVLGRLAAIENLSGCGCPPDLPSPDDPTGCADPFVSISRAVLVSAYPGRIFAVFPSPVPDGLVVTDGMDLGEVGVEISPEATWTGWRAFVYSKSAAYYSEDPTRSGLWATNVWRDLDEAMSYALAFSVPDGNDIAVYLCAPPPAPVDECVHVVSLSTPYGHYSSDWPNSSPPQATAGGGDLAYATPNAPFVGWIVGNIDPPDAGINLWRNGGGHGAIGEGFVIDAQAEGVSIEFYATNGLPFTLDLCPPEE